MLDEFNKWCFYNRYPKNIETGKYIETEDLFVMFLQSHYKDLSATEMLESLAWQIYNLQVCVEGLIEDNS